MFGILNGKDQPMGQAILSIYISIIVSHVCFLYVLSLRFLPISTSTSLYEACLHYVHHVSYVYPSCPILFPAFVQVETGNISQAYINLKRLGGQ